MNYETLKANLLLAAVQLCFSGWHILGKIALGDGADPIAFALYREWLASFLMLAVVKYRGLNIAVPKEDRLRFFFLGCCSFTNVVGCIISLQYISATRFSIMQPSIPVFGATISIIIGIEKVNLYKVVGIAAAVGGAVLVELWSSGDEDEEENVSLGLAIVVVQCLAMASLIVFQKPLLDKYDSTVLTYVYYTIGAAITLLLCICWAIRFSATDFYFDGKYSTWLALTYASTFATLFTYNAYSWVSKITSPSVVTVYSTLQPCFTALLSLAIYNEVISVSEVIGGLLVGLGLLLTVRGRIVEARAEDENLGYLPLAADGSHKDSKDFATDSLRDNDRNNQQRLSSLNSSQASVVSASDERLSGRSTTIANPLAYPQLRH